MKICKLPGKLTSALTSDLMELEVPSVESDASFSRTDTASDDEETRQSGI